MILQKTYNPTGLPIVETAQIVDVDLISATPLMLARSGSVYSLTDDANMLLNGQLFYLFDSTTGVITFGFPFNSGEDIELIYKTI